MPTSTTVQRFPYSYRVVNKTDEVVTDDATNSGLLPATDSVTLSGPLDGWRNLIRNGDNATTSAFGTKWNSIQGNSSIEVLRKNTLLPFPSGSRRTVITGNFPPLGLPSFALDMSDTSANNQALTRFYNRISSQETAFKGMVFTGELAESLAMIRRPAASLRRGIGDYLRNLRRLRNKSTKRARLKAVRDSWLEYSFGWMPLISDIDSGVKAFYGSNLVRPIFKMLSAEGQSDEVFDLPFETTGVGSNFNLLYRVRMTQSVNVRYRGVYDSRGGGIPDSHHYGFRPSEFLPTLWELIPYSFLVDYFTNIGDIVSSWSYRFIGCRWSSRTIYRIGSYKTIGMKVYPINEPYPYEHTILGADLGSSETSRHSFVRTPSVVLGVPSLELQVPGMGTKWVNIIALATDLKATRHAIAR